MKHSRHSAARLARERRTMEAMVALYCRAHHAAGLTGAAAPRALCGDCRELLDYAFARIERCPLGVDKSTCAQCTIHCYKPAMRERVRQVMRYAGPRMLLRHPLLALWHLVDSRRRTPEEPHSPCEKDRFPPK